MVRRRVRLPGRARAQAAAVALVEAFDPRANAPSRVRAADATNAFWFARARRPRALALLWVQGVRVDAVFTSRDDDATNRDMLGGHNPEGFSRFRGTASSAACVFLALSGFLCVHVRHALGAEGAGAAGLGGAAARPRPAAARARARATRSRRAACSRSACGA